MKVPTPTRLEKGNPLFELVNKLSKEIAEFTLLSLEAEKLEYPMLTVYMNVLSCAMVRVAKHHIKEAGVEHFMRILSKQMELNFEAHFKNGAQL